MYLYVISCRLDRVKIGIAADAEKRLRQLQVGSPVELRLALTRPYAERRDADAVADELYRHFAGRRDRGSWYRLTVTEVRERLAQRASLEAPARARAAAEAATAERRAPRRGGQQLRARTEQQLAYERRRRQERTRKQKRAAKLRAQGMTQQAVALELDVTTRTLRNWKDAPAFRRELERRRTQAAPRSDSAPSNERKRRPRREAAKRHDRASKADPAAGGQPDRAPAPPSQTTIDLYDGLPIFPDTAEGRVARLAYYEARKLTNPPYSLYDYTDAKRGDAPPLERRARERRDSRRRQ